MQGTPSQLTLNVGLQEKATFENFFAESNTETFGSLAAFLESAPDLRQIYLWGGAGTGKSHLQQALCHQAAELNKTSVYLPVSVLVESDLDILNDMEQVDLACLDGLDSIIDNTEWQHALFHFINRSRDCGQKLVLASRESPQIFAGILADLHSRLIAGPVYHLTGLTDSQKQAALKNYADSRGFAITDKVCNYLLQNHHRNMGNLMEILDRLDAASLRDKKTITVPYIRQILPKP